MTIAADNDNDLPASPRWAPPAPNIDELLRQLQVLEERLELLEALADHREKSALSHT